MELLEQDRSVQQVPVASRQVLQVSTVTRQGERDLIKLRPFARISTTLSGPQPSAQAIRWARSLRSSQDEQISCSCELDARLSQAVRCSAVAGASCRRPRTRSSRACWRSER